MSQKDVFLALRKKVSKLMHKWLPSQNYLKMSLVWFIFKEKIKHTSVNYLQAFRIMYVNRNILSKKISGDFYSLSVYLEKPSRSTFSSYVCCSVH